MKRQRQKLFRVVLAGVLMIFSFMVYAQERIVTGKVYDSSGESIIGASVMVQGTMQGVVTDIDGAFQLKVQPSQSLVISFLGYQDVILPVGSKNNFKIILEEDSKKLDEVVVVGYATQKKVNLTGSVASVSAKDIQDIPVANTTTLLQGRLPGLVLTQNGAQAGNDNPEIRIRGIGTFGNNNPMVLIDGVEGSISQIAEIPSADIESISVLKDAASAAIYGVRAANGVILITTKRGQASSKVKISYSGSYTLQTPGIVPDYVDGYNWALMKNEVSTGTFSPEALQKLQDGSDPDHYANTNWLDAVLRNASMHQHHLSVSGGNENTRFMTSVAYSNQDGIMMKTGVERFSFRSNIDTRYKRFTFGLNLSGNKNNVTTPAVAPSGEGGIMRYVSWFTRPTVPVMYSNGHYGYVDGSSLSAELMKNPVESMSLGHRSNEYWRFNGKVFAGIDLWDGLKFQTSFAYAFDLNATKSYSPKSPARYDAEGNIRKAAGETNKEEDYWYRNATWTSENLLTYNKQFDKHNVNVLLGHSVIGSRFYKTTASIQGFPTENIYELDGGTINPGAKGNSEEYKLQSFFGRVNYGYDDRYLFEFNAGYNGSENFMKGKRFGFFPSVSVGWRITNEEFMKGTQDWLNNLKLRASYGQVGNDIYKIGGAKQRFLYEQKWNQIGNDYRYGETWQSGIYESQYPNYGVTWERAHKYNLGLEFGLWNGLLSGNLDLFYEKRNDILTQYLTRPQWVGVAMAAANLGKTKNSGYEIELKHANHIGKDFNYTVGLTYSHAKNEILMMDEPDLKTDYRKREGHPINQYFGLVCDGFITQADIDGGKLPVSKLGENVGIGDLKYRDMNGDGLIDERDETFIGYSDIPENTYALSLGANYKNWGFSVMFQGVNHVSRYYDAEAMFAFVNGGKVKEHHLDRWNPSKSEAENLANAKYPRLHYDSYGNHNQRGNSFFLKNGAFMRLKNIELSYTLPTLWAKKVGMSDCRLYVNANNLITWDDLDGLTDPESNGSNRYPIMKTVNFGVNIKF